MWSRGLLGTDVYHLMATFVIYSILGWLIESIYMSFCNRKITNRGFAKSPFCPIYGFGATLGYLLLSPFRQNVFVVYIVGAVLATIFEYLVGILMIKLFGELWWDYNDKPFNYKGILCLESTIAWGFYGLGVVYILHEKILQFVDLIHPAYGHLAIIVIMTIVFVDYVIQLCVAFKIDVKEKKNILVQKYRSFKDRW